MDQLNKEQRRAVEAPDGPVLVLAGAGSGKTRVIVERLAYLVNERGVDQRRLLAVTFTNRAAREMKSRVTQRLGVDRLAAWLGTFHAFGLSLLRRHGDRLPCGRDFTILDDADQLTLMKRLVKELPDTFTAVSPRNALDWISELKQRCAQPPAEAEAPEDLTYQTLWQRYHGSLRDSRAVDFDDLLALPVRLLEDEADLAARYRDRFRYVHVDEYQDTNHAQYRFARALTGPDGNLFVVGDEDQSIYSWRGADINNILDFQKDFQNAEVVRLEQNYRSTESILNAANAVVANNALRLGKNLWTERKGGDKVELFHAEDGQAEAKYVAETIAKSRDVDTAVLYRTGNQSRAFEQALQAKGVAYAVVGGVKFYARREIKDIVAYLRLLVNPRDDEALRRIVNTPPRGLGGQTVAQVEDFARERNLPLFEVIRELEHDQTFSTRARNALSDFVRLVDDLTLEAASAPVAAVAEAALERTAYREYLEQSDERDYQTRLENLDEFVSACGEFDSRDAGGVLEYLQNMALMTDVDDWDPSAAPVSLLTCHSAKGLEFDRVFLVGLEEGYLPHARAVEEGAGGSGSDEELEEERRLCYVAMTRARMRLILTAARRRSLFGREEERQLSRFAGEIPAGQLQVAGRAGKTAPKGKPKPAGGPPADAGQLKMGSRVRHPRFGAGTVMYTKGTGSKQRVRVRFQTGRSREFLLRAAPLEIVEGKKR